MKRLFRDHASAWLVAAGLLAAVALAHPASPVAFGGDGLQRTMPLGGSLVRVPGQEPWQTVAGQDGLPASPLQDERLEARELASEPEPAWQRGVASGETVVHALAATQLCVPDVTAMNAF